MLALGLLVLSALLSPRAAAEDWSALGAGLATDGYDLSHPPSRMLAAHGATVYAATTPAGTAFGPYRRVARWQGGAWTTILDAPLGVIIAGLAVDPANGHLYAFGQGGFPVAGGQSASVARWDGTGWHGLAGGLGSGDASPAIGSPLVSDAVVDGSGRLVVSGRFGLPGDASSVHFARWDGSAWSVLAPGAPASGGHLALAGDGTIYTASARIHRLDGASWTEIGVLANGGVSAEVEAMVVDAQGRLVIGGDFLSVSGVPAARIARWNGTAWAPLGAGFNATVWGLAADGDRIYATGIFNNVPGQPLSNPLWRHIARWDGAWSSLGGGLDDTGHAVAIGGTAASPAIYVNGRFTSVGGGVAAQRIARWQASSSGTGSGTTSTGGGTAGGGGTTVGTGPALTGPDGGGGCGLGGGLAALAALALRRRRG